MRASPQAERGCGFPCFLKLRRGSRYWSDLRLTSVWQANRKGKLVFCNAGHICVPRRKQEEMRTEQTRGGREHVDVTHAQLYQPKVRPQCTAQELSHSRAVRYALTDWLQFISESDSFACLFRRTGQRLVKKSGGMKERKTKRKLCLKRLQWNPFPVSWDYTSRRESEDEISFEALW